MYAVLSYYAIEKAVKQGTQVLKPSRLTLADHLIHLKLFHTKGSITYFQRFTVNINSDNVCEDTAHQY